MFKNLLIGTVKVAVSVTIVVAGVLIADEIKSKMNKDEL